MRGAILFVVTVALAVPLGAHDRVSDDFDLQQMIDEIAGATDLDIPYESMLDNLMQLLAEPYDLNRVTPDELRLLGFLSERQINNIMEHREQYGEFISVYELQSVPGFDEITLTRLAHFIRVQEPAARMHKSILRRMVENKSMYLVSRYGRTLQQKAGFDPQRNAFQGRPGHIYTRFRSSSPGDFSVGFTLEKDPGEPFVWKPIGRAGFDHFSFHVQLQNKGKIRNLIVGDYQVQAGQGLLLGGLFGLGKGGGETVSTVRRSNLGGLPFTSSSESGYLRGGLLTYQLSPGVLLTGFYSHALRDAALETDTAEQQLATAFRSSGLHHTASEIRGRKVVTEKNAGIILNYKRKNLDTGILWNAIAFDTPLRRNPTRYNQFAFQGSHNQNASFFLNYNLANHAFFSEVAATVDGGWAVLTGVLTSLSQKLDLGIAYRHYARNFHTFYSNALGEGSLVQNEIGLYWGWKYRFDKHFELSGYADLFQFPWLKYRTYAPSRGYEWLLRISREVSKGTRFYAQMREESKGRNTAGETALYAVNQGLKRNYLLWARMKTGSALTLKTRIQYSTYTIDAKTTEGFVIMQDMGLDAGKLKVAARYALFDTDDYDNRQYVYERDAWLSFSLPAYNGVGVRNYVMIGYTLGSHLTLWLRYAHTRYTDRDTIGSGLDEISGNQKNDIKFQVRYKF